MMFIKSELNRKMIAAMFVSILCHIFCFAGVEPTFRKLTGRSTGFSEIFFLGPILEENNYYLQSDSQIEESRNRLNAKDMLTPLERNTLIRRDFLTGLRVKSSPVYESDLGLINFKKPHIDNLIDNKITHFKPFSISTNRRSGASIMFYPQMPYHFLLYFKDRQIAHVEIAFYISPKGRVIGIKRKISSGNPEVDLLIMRNLAHFLNLCKSNFALGSWKTVKIDLSP